MKETLTQIRQRLASLAPPLFENAQRAAGITEEELAELEAALGTKVPDELAEWLRFSNGGLGVWEYEGLSHASIISTWKIYTTAQQAGEYDDHEVFDDSTEVFQLVKWDRGWIPFAQDGGGNLFLVDTNPGPKGKVGQVLRWEMAGGPSAQSCRSLSEYLSRYLGLLRSGDYSFDEDSHTFDGWADDQYP